MYIGYKDAITGDRWIGDEIHPDNPILCVSMRDGHYYIFNAYLGKPFIRVRFKTKELAVQFGGILHRKYGEYFDILKLKDWKDVDMINLFQWTVSEGQEIAEVVKEMKEQNEICDSRYFSRFI